MKGLFVVIWTLNATPIRSQGEKIRAIVKASIILENICIINRMLVKYEHERPFW